MERNGITEYFEKVEWYEEYDGYFCSVAEVITISILGNLCGLKNVNQIHQLACSDKVSEFLGGIQNLSCALLWLDIISTETDQIGIAQPLLCGLNLFVYARKIWGYWQFQKLWLQMHWTARKKRLRSLWIRRPLMFILRRIRAE